MNKRRLIYRILLVGIPIALVATARQSNPAIASYNHFVAPNIKISRAYSPADKSRFYPSPRKYEHIKTIHYKQRIVNSKLNPKYIQSADNQRDISQKLVSLQTQYQLLPSYRRAPLKKRVQVLKRHIHLKIAINKCTRDLRRASVYTSRQPKYNISRKLVNRTRSLVIYPKYKIHRFHSHKIIYLHSNYPIWKSPYKPDVPWTSSTNRLANDGQAMEIISRATSHKHEFYHIKSSGYDYGWISPQAIRKAHIYQMPFHYYSQMHPLYAPDACEAVALRMALSVKGRNPQISMRRFINRIPRSKNPEYGYTASPYHYGDNASIYPKALAKYGRRYDKHVYAFTGITKHRLIHELEDGNPVVFEGSYRMKDTDSDHTLVLVGYSDDSLKFADPYYTKDENQPISWVSIKQFTKLFHQHLRGSRAVVVK